MLQLLIIGFSMDLRREKVENMLDYKEARHICEDIDKLLHEAEKRIQKLKDEK